MDNILFDIRGDKDQLKPALDYLKTIAPGGKASHYAIVPRKGLVLFWHNPGTDTLCFKNPEKKDDFGTIVKVEIKTFDINWEDFVVAWLQSVNLDDFDLGEWEKEPELYSDVSIGRGFRMTCDEWGHVAGDRYAFALIKPIAAWYGK